MQMTNGPDGRFDIFRRSANADNRPESNDIALPEDNQSPAATDTLNDIGPIADRQTLTNNALPAPSDEYATHGSALIEVEDTESRRDNVGGVMPANRRGDVALLGNRQAPDFVVELFAGTEEKMQQRGDTMNGKWADAAAAFVTELAARAESEAASEVNASSPVGDISLERVRREPGAIRDMIDVAPRTTFHECVIEAAAEGGALDKLKDKMTFFADEDLGEAREPSGEPHGLLPSLYLTPDDRAAIRDQQGPRGLKNENNMNEIDVRKLQSALAPSFSVTMTAGAGTGRNKAFRQVREYIGKVDGRIKRAQEQGGSAPIGSDGTTDRLLRTAAVEYGEAFERSSSAGVHPAEAGRRAGGLLGASSAELTRMAGGPSNTTESSIHRETSLQTAQNYVLEALWGDVARARAILERQRSWLGGSSGESHNNPAKVGYDQKMALAVSYENVLDRERLGDDRAMAKLGQTLVGVAAQETNEGTTTVSRGDESYLALQLPYYSDSMLSRDLSVARAVRDIIAQRDPQAAQAYEGYVVGIVTKAVAGSDRTAQARAGDGSAVNDRASALSDTTRRLMTASDYARIEAAHRERMAMVNGALGIDDAAETGFRDDMAGARLARTHDGSGAYEGSRLATEIDIANARQAKDFAGDDRAFAYYGENRPEDGMPGGNEAHVAMSGLVKHIDSYGVDLKTNPMSDPAFRSAIKSQAESLGVEVTVHRPLQDMPVRGRQWKIGHWHGRLPDSFEPRHILDRILPGGYATTAIEANTELITQIKLAVDPRQRAVAAEAGKSPYRGPKYDGEFAYIQSPTELVRITDDDQNVRVTLGHADPKWEWKEHTLVLFRHTKDASGRYLPNRLFSMILAQLAEMREQ